VRTPFCVVGRVETSLAKVLPSRKGNASPLLGACPDERFESKKRKARPGSLGRGPRKTLARWIICRVPTARKEKGEESPKSPIPLPCPLFPPSPNSRGLRGEKRTRTRFQMCQREEGGGGGGKRGGDIGVALGVLLSLFLAEEAKGGGGSRHVPCVLLRLLLGDTKGKKKKKKKDQLLIYSFFP